MRFKVRVILTFSPAGTMSLDAAQRGNADQSGLNHGTLVTPQVWGKGVAGCRSVRLHRRGDILDSVNHVLDLSVVSEHRLVQRLEVSLHELTIQLDIVTLNG